MPKPTPTRKARFRAALALAGMTQEQWAEQQGVSSQQVGAVAAGDRESKRLEAEMDAFIAEHLPSTAAA